MFYFGPNNKSLFTQELELVAKCLLHTYENATIYTQNEATKPEFHVKFDEIDINLTSLYKKVNFNHLRLNEKDSTTYIEKIAAYVSYGEDRFFRIDELNVPLVDDLTPAEVRAIRNFTGNSFGDINRMLYGNTSWLWHDKEAIIESVLIASGLNKMPSGLDFENAYTYRGESSISIEQIQHRIDLVNQGGGITHEPAFMSTSLDHSVAMGFSGYYAIDKSIIIFEDVYGKNVADISYFPGEKEFLLTPSTVLWDGYEYRDGIHFFHAKVVSPLESLEPTVEDCEVFSKLLNWASYHDIATDFVTPFVKNQIEHAQLASSLIEDENLSNNISKPQDGLATDFTIIEHEHEQVWLTKVHEILECYHRNFMPSFDQFNDMFSAEVIRSEEVIDANVAVVDISSKPIEILMLSDNKVNLEVLVPINPIELIVMG